jgi:hypothetical protein
MKQARLVLTLAVIAGAACARLSPSESVPAPAVAAARPHHHQGPQSYTAHLTPSDSLSTLHLGDGGSTHSNGKMRFVLRDDDTFEYHLTIYNDDRRVFSAARIYRRAPADERVVVTLFTGETLSGPYIQVRGTTPVRPDVDPHEWLAELARNPSEFVIRIEQRGGAGGGLQGTPIARAR